MLSIFRQQTVLQKASRGLPRISGMTATRTAARRLWMAAFVLTAIGLIAVVHRLVVLASPGAGTGSGPRASLNVGFANHSALTLLHILPGALFLPAGLAQFSRRLRSRHPAVHRWLGRILVLDGRLVGVTALVMSAVMSIGGALESTATSLFAVIFLYSMLRAWLHIRRREIAQHREWMIRAFATGLAVATIRPIIGIFFATRVLTPHQFFGIAFWIGFLLNATVAEWWIRTTRVPTAAASRA